MMSKRAERCLCLFLTSVSVMLHPVQGFSSSSMTKISSKSLHHQLPMQRHDDDDDKGIVTFITDRKNNARRDLLTKLPLSLVGLLAAAYGNVASASVGTLPEFATTNAILQGLTVNVADKSQQDAMIAFLKDSFDFQILRQRIIGPITETWMGFGPEELSIPPDFVIPVSSLALYGGHASIRIRYDEKATTVFYRQGEAAPGDNIAFLQVGVPTYRVSQMVKNGGNVLDAYGYVNVVSPCGLPIRAIVGISPDPIMFVAINCQDVKQSKLFYEQLGFVEQEYPYARLSKGTSQFEPPQPKNSVYLAPSANCMGILLLQNPKKKNPTPNPALESLQIIYSPSGEAPDSDATKLIDPSGVAFSFVSVDRFVKEEKETR